MNIKKIISINTDTHKILLETNEAIITASSKEIYLMEILEVNKFVLYANNEKYMIQCYKDKYQDFILKVGFIQIHKNFAINPNKISAFKISTMELEIENQQIITVNQKYKKNLLNYLNSFSIIQVQSI